MDDDHIELDVASLHRDLQSGTRSAELITSALLKRIRSIDAKLKAYEHLAETSAARAAVALDSLRAAGTDLGPLMGIPVVVKDLVAVSGMPLTAGSHVDVNWLVGPEGTFIRRLRAAGCVLLGKAKTVEFGMGGSGLSSARGTPWNPHDLVTHRAPGGSSSGSAVAVAAGLAGFAVGSDTGGSVRVPAAFSGVVGWKTSKGLFPTDGVFPLSPGLDTLGILSRSAADAAIVFAAVAGQSRPAVRPLLGLRVGRPGPFFADDLAPEVARRFAAACDELERAGVVLVDIELPHAHDLHNLFRTRNGADLVGTFGADRFEACRDKLGPEIASRLAVGLTVKAHEYLAMLNLQHRLTAEAAAAMAEVDCWISPTAPMTAPAVSEFDTAERLETDTCRFTRQANYYGLCALSLPIPGPSGALPVGLQIVCPFNADARLLSIAQAIEQCLGRAALPDVAPLFK